MVFINLLILLGLIFLILYLVPRREKIGGWLWQRFQLSEKGDKKKENKGNGEEI